MQIRFCRCDVGIDLACASPWVQVPSQMSAQVRDVPWAPIGCGARPLLLCVACLLHSVCVALRFMRSVSRVASGGSRPGLILWRSTLRFDFAVICALGSAVCNSLRALRPLRSNRHTEHDNVSRCARPDPRAQITAAPDCAPAGHRLPRRGRGGRALRSIHLSRADPAMHSPDYSARNLRAQPSCRSREAQGGQGSFWGGCDLCSGVGSRAARHVVMLGVPV